MGVFYFCDLQVMGFEAVAIPPSSKSEEGETCPKVCFVARSSLKRVLNFVRVSAILRRKSPISLTNLIKIPRSRKWARFFLLQKLFMWLFNSKTKCQASNTPEFKLFINVFNWFIRARSSHCNNCGDIMIRSRNRPYSSFHIVRVQ